MEKLNVPPELQNSTFISEGLCLNKDNTIIKSFMNSSIDHSLNGG